ncbi:hypothetical protein PG984_005404 [Apiospora sp. TS-2023a]
MRALRMNPDTAILAALKDGGASPIRKNSKGETAEDIADRLVSIKAKQTLLDVDQQNSGATELARFILSAFLLLLAYLRPWQKFKDAVVAGIKLIYDEIVKPGMGATKPLYPATKKELHDVLEEVITQQGLESFFPPGHPLLLEILDQAYSVVNGPASSPGMVRSSPRMARMVRSQVASHFLFAIYQPVIYCDDSGSMAAENRMVSQAEIVSFMSDLMLMFSPADKGVHLRFINKTAPGMDGLKDSALRAQLNFTPAGSTKLGTGLNGKVLNPLIYSVIDANQTFERPIFVLTITDGIPNEEGPNTFVDAMTACSQRVANANYPLYSAKFSVSQVGSDVQSAAFLDKLQVESNKPQYRDILHVTAEKLDAKYSQLRDNKLELNNWLRTTLTAALGGP